MHEAMSFARSFSTAGLWIALAAWPIITAGPAAAQTALASSDPMEVTTDTPAYCLQLLDRVSELVRLASAPVPREVTELTTEGQRMCAHGQTRMGIMRLRSAVMMMEKPDSPSDR